MKAGIPGSDVLPVGIILVDPIQDRLYVRMRRDWDDIAPEEAEVLALLGQDLENKSREMGASGVLAYLEETLSNTLQISEFDQVMVEDFDRGLARLYRQHVASTVRPFVTHLPRYSVAVAAGKFLDNSEVTEEGWEETPADMRLSADMFIARITGRSMEPAIPDDSFCVFRSGVTGSRQGRLVLVEALGRGENDRYTVKRYHSEKTQLPDGTWSHERIRLEPLNPEFEAWDLDPEEERYRIIAEFVRVLD